MSRPRDKIYLQAVVASLKRLIADDSLKRLVDLAGTGEVDLLQEAMALSMGFLSPPVEGYGNPTDCLMTCILEEIKRGVDAPAEYAIEPGRFSLDDHLFPKRIQQVQHRHDLAELQAALSQFTASSNAEVTAENLLDLLFNHASTVPCSPRLRDVSLYDQTRMMAALHVLLHDIDGDALDTERPFLLIGGDFSGIQNYIYEIVSKYAGKNLKGRSFYVKLLGDAVVRYMLAKLDLYRSHVVYNSGGGFFILAANTQRTLDALHEAIVEIEDKLFTAHDTAIYVAIDSIAISCEEVAGTNGSELKERWSELFVKRDAIKQRRYATMLSEGYHRFFDPVAVNTDLRDAITGLDLTEENSCTFRGIDGYMSKLNMAQIKIGAALRDSKCIAAINGKFDEWEAQPHIEPAGLGITYYLLRDENMAHEADALGVAAHIKVLNDPVNRYGNNICYREFYGGNQHVDTFEQMCESEGDFERLGVLRMDVDNLGSIFQKGLDPTITSLTRYATLSRSLDVFFSGYLNTLCGNNSRLFILYSGGDDLFIVGEWREVIKIAESIRLRFGEYACQNPAFHISGGVSLVKAKYPLIAGAQLSAEEESCAKTHKCGDAEKDSISLIGSALHWSKEFPVVKKLKERIFGLITRQEKPLPKSFLSKVLLHAKNAGLKNHRINEIKTYWMLSYDLSRFRERTNEAGGVNELIDECKREICTPNGTLGAQPIITDYHPLELWALACRWAELEYRTIRQQIH